AVLRVLGYFVNSFAEPQPGRDRFRLGNVFHRRPQASPPRTEDLCERRWFAAEKVFDFRTGNPKPDPKLITERVSFIDCSDRPRRCAGGPGRVSWSPPLRDFFALVLDLTGIADCHSGYFEDSAVWQRIHAAVCMRLPKGEPGNEVLGAGAPR